MKYSGPIPGPLSKALITGKQYATGMGEGRVNFRLKISGGKCSQTLTFQMGGWRPTKEGEQCLLAKAQG